MNTPSLEDFVLADDRAQALESFVPGTEEHLYHRCLLLQQGGQLAEVEGLLAGWSRAFGETERRQQIERRQRLLTYHEQPDSRSRIATELGIRTDHPSPQHEQTLQLPCRLDPALLAPEALLRAGAAFHEFQGFTDEALPWLATTELARQRGPALLQRLRRPDAAGLVALIEQEMASSRRRPAFGSLPIHRELTLAQLDQLAASRPALLDEATFVDTYLQKLRPPAGVDLDQDDEALEAHLDRLERFISRLSPAFASQQAQVRYHRLALDRRRGVLDRGRLLAYLATPRRSAQIAQELLTQSPHPAGRLDQDLRGTLGLPPPRDDGALIGDLLAAALRLDADLTPFRGLLRAEYPSEKRAEEMLLSGAPDQERWVRELGPAAAFTALRDRVELTLAPTNPARFAADAPVSLALDVKNVPSLVVRVFALHERNVFLETGKTARLAIDLDGLVPTEERLIPLDQAPIRRVRQVLEFPSLAGPGTFVIDILGGGQNCRALIRKGRLRKLERVSAAGHALTVVDDQGRRVEGATAWVGGREYSADPEGEIIIPFAAGEPRQALLCHGELATLVRLERVTESYQLAATFDLPRESLIAGQKASILVHAELTVGGVARVSLGLLEDLSLRICSTDRKGTTTERTISGVSLDASRETAVEFQVPEGLRALAFVLQGKVRRLQDGSSQPVSASRQIELNRVDDGASTGQLHLARRPGGHALSLLGKSGEPRPAEIIEIQISHGHLQYPITVRLRTDDRGEVDLGPLPGVARLRALHASSPPGNWSLLRAPVSYPAELHLRAGVAIRLPLAGGSALDPLSFSLLERRQDRYQRDGLDRLSLGDGLLEIGGLEPGDYELRLPAATRPVTLRVREARAHQGWLLTGTETLAPTPYRPLRITTLSVDRDTLRVAVAQASPRARVHLTALHFVPHEPPGASLPGAAPSAGVEETPDADARYASGRDIGDEYRYVLGRRHARRFAGNMLPRPGALLNPWSRQETNTGLDEVEDDDVFKDDSPKKAKKASLGTRSFASPWTQEDTAHQLSFEFLPRPAVVLTNLALDERGQLLVPLARLAGLSLLRVTVVDGAAQVTDEIPLPGGPITPRDLRLLRPFGAGDGYLQTRQATPRLTGAELIQEDITTSRLELHDSIGKVFALFRTLLAGHEHLDSFAFVPRWNTLDHAEKCALYSEHACHELSFFLSRKDRPFFDGVVAPYLRNKRHRTFLDRYLLGDDLTSYLRPWAHARLNTVERILLGERTGRREEIARQIAELDEARPRPAGERRRLFEIALRASSLDDDTLGLTAAATTARDEADERASPSRRREAASPASFGPPDPFGPPPGAPPPPPGFGGPPSFGGPPGLGAVAASPKAAQDKKKEESATDDFAFMADMDDEVARDVGARDRSRPLYRPVEVTRELAEQHYYRRRLDEQGPDLVLPGAFWVDLARHDGRTPFLSPHLHKAARSFTEAMFALSFLDLPFEAERHEAQFEGARLRLIPRGPLVAYEEQIQATSPAPGSASVLVGRRYLRAADGADLGADEELLTHTPYRMQVVLTNPTPVACDPGVLLQIPQGAVAVAGGQPTLGLRESLPPFGVKTLELGFYFPSPGQFVHAPVQVGIDGRVVAQGPGATLRVVRTSSRLDRDSFEQVARAGSPEEVLALLRSRNLARLDLSQIAWRLRDAAFYREVIALLSQRLTFHRELWGYAFLHGDVPRIQELLELETNFLASAGPHLQTPTLTVDAIERGTHEHLEYAPLVNARAHRPAGAVKILNERFAAHYERFLDYLRFKPQISDDDRLSLVIYLLLQDRVDEAREAFARLDASRLPCALQLDYLRCYLAFSGEQPGEARAIAVQRADEPLPRWGVLFRNVLAQLDEAEGAHAAVSDLSDRDQRQNQLASTEPLLELRVEGAEAILTHRHLPRCQLAYYPMDSELLFSRQPFEQHHSRQFAFVRPAQIEPIELETEEGERRVPLPASMIGKNLVIEAQGGGIRRSQRHLASGLVIQLMEAYGQLKVTHTATGAPLSRVYVKVYARSAAGQVRFHKDGYTDLRGRFDYASLSGDAAPAERFALLILSDEHGAQVREAAPPA